MSPPQRPQHREIDAAACPPLGSRDGIVSARTSALIGAETGFAIATRDSGQGRHRSFATFSAILPMPAPHESGHFPVPLPEEWLCMTDRDTSRDADTAKDRKGAKSILAQARKDWDAAEQRERHNIRLAYEDLEFLAGDELSQWP